MAGESEYGLRYPLVCDVATADPPIRAVREGGDRATGLGAHVIAAHYYPGLSMSC